MTQPKLSSLDIPAPLLQAIEDLGFEYCTAIQAASLPIALEGRDVAGQAQTGTGKTAAFLIATLTHLLKSPPPEHRKINQPRAIILAPTRELVIQIHKDAEDLAKHTEIKLGLAYGGTGYTSQRQHIEQGVDLLIGTPGRIIDYYKQNIFNLKAIQVVVLDEADRMFDLGFIKDIRYLLRQMPKPENRLSLLFSATLSMRVSELAYEHMNNPEQVAIAEQITASDVTELIYFPASDEKIQLLLGVLAGHDVTRTMIFVNTKRVAQKVEDYLVANDFEAAVISGDVPQKKRIRLLTNFTQGKLPILIATDVAARGLHIEGISHVINFDLPQDAEDYVHRIGRTARAGATGDAISFACEEYSFSLGEIEEYIGHKIPVAPIDKSLLIEPKQPPRSTRRRSSSHKKSHHRGGGRPRSNTASGPRQASSSEDGKKSSRKRSRSRHPAASTKRDSS